MTVIAAPARSAPTPRSPLASAACAALLLAAVVVGPAPIASWWSGYTDGLREAVGPAFVDFWAAGTATMAPDLADAVEYWAWFHVVKAVLGAALLVASGLLTVRGGRALARAEGRRRRLGLGAATVLGVLVSSFALLVVVANAQAAVAPLSSALTLLPLDGSDPEVSVAAGQVGTALAEGARAPALDVLLRDYVLYHEVMVWLGALTAVGLLSVGVALWVRRSRIPRTERRGRRVLATVVLWLLAFGSFFGLVTVANASTVADPEPGLLAFFEGGR